MFGVDGADFIVPNVERWDTMADALQQRVNEKKIYEELVNIIVDYVNKEYSSNEPARLRIYKLVADNFDGMVRALTAPLPKTPSLLNNIENGDTENE